jgi:hypothetical protein
MSARKIPINRKTCKISIINIILLVSNESSDYNENKEVYDNNFS